MKFWAEDWGRVLIETWYDIFSRQASLMVGKLYDNNFSLTMDRKDDNLQSYRCFNSTTFNIKVSQLSINVGCFLIVHYLKWSLQSLIFLNNLTKDVRWPNWRLPIMKNHEITKLVMRLPFFRWNKIALVFNLIRIFNKLNYSIKCGISLQVILPFKCFWLVLTSPWRTFFFSHIINVSLSLSENNLPNFTVNMAELVMIEAIPNQSHLLDGQIVPSTLDVLIVHSYYI